MLQDILQALQRLCFPRHCRCCQTSIQPPAFLCTWCHDQIPRWQYPLCHQCTRPISMRQAGKYCSNCAQRAMAFDHAFGCFYYQSPLIELITAFKFKGQDYLADYLSSLMIQRLEQHHYPMKSFDAIIPIPLTPESLRQRGYNQALLLAKPIAQHFKLALLSSALQCHHPRISQRHLNANNRWTNLDGAFKITDDISYLRNVLIIDDVLTTGATLHHASLILKAHGVTKVSALTLSITI